MTLFDKSRNRKEKQISKAKQDIQADYELEQRQANKTPIGTVSTTVKPKKQYTQKEWNRFSDSQKQILTNRYDVILTDHKTRNEKIKGAAKKINLKNFDSAMKRIDKGQKQFWSEFDKGLSDAGLGKKGTLYPKKSTNSVNIAGKKSKSNSITTIFGSGKTKKAKRVNVF